MGRLAQNFFRFIEEVRFSSLIVCNVNLLCIMQLPNPFGYVCKQIDQYILDPWLDWRDVKTLALSVCLFVCLFICNTFSMTGRGGKGKFIFCPKWGKWVIFWPKINSFELSVNLYCSMSATMVG